MSENSKCSDDELFEFHVPYQPGTNTLSFKTDSADKWLRVHSTNNQIRRWILRESDIIGLSAKEVRKKFSLPFDPTEISEVHVPVGTLIRRGFVAANLGGAPGATQHEILDDISSVWFQNRKPYKDFFAVSNEEPKVAEEVRTSNEMIFGRGIVTLPGPVLKRLNFNDLVIVLFSGYDCVPHTMNIVNHNVVALGHSGNLVWGIEGWTGDGWNAYTNIWINEEGKLMAGSAMGFDFIVNPADGTLTPWRDPN